MPFCDEKNCLYRHIETELFPYTIPDFTYCSHQIYACDWIQFKPNIFVVFNMVWLDLTLKNDVFLCGFLSHRMAIWRQPSFAVGIFGMCMCSKHHYNRKFSAELSTANKFVSYYSFTCSALALCVCTPTGVCFHVFHRMWQLNLSESCVQSHSISTTNKCLAQCTDECVSIVWFCSIRIIALAISKEIFGLQTMKED